MTLTEARNKIELLEQECRNLNDDLTQKELLIERMVSALEKQTLVITKLLDRL